MIGTASRWSPAADEDLDREIEIIARALVDRGTIRREELAQAVGARYWGPGRFRAALREAVEEGRARRVARTPTRRPSTATAERTIRSAPPPAPGVP